MECVRCGSVIDREIYNSDKYCSFRCGKLWLKAQYKIRKGIQKSSYIPNLNNDTRAITKFKKFEKDLRYKAKTRQRSKKFEAKTCEICESIYNVHRHHEDYKNSKNVNILCQKCHQKYHRIKNIDPSLTIGDYERGIKDGKLVIRLGDSPLPYREG